MKNALKLNSLMIAASDSKKRFKSMVDFYGKRHAHREVHSNGPEHSTEVFCDMMYQTRREVLILLNGFTGEVSQNPDYYSAMARCLFRGVRVKVLCLQDPNTSSRVFNLLKTFPNQVQWKKCSPTAKTYLSGQFATYGCICHFATFDSDKYRLEIIPDRFISVSNFCDPAKNEELREIFHQAFELSK